jgi:hypothetical protein
MNENIDLATVFVGQIDGKELKAADRRENLVFCTRGRKATQD